METRSGPLKNYKIGKSINAGPFWRIMIATNNLTSEEVAIKYVDRNRMKGMGMEEIVNKEIDNLRSVACSNVVKLHDVIETSDAIYTVTEYCKNGELFDYVISKGYLQEDEARRIFRQIISGVEHCHRNMIAHCDLKLENLLLDEQYNVKLANFEFSNIMKDGRFLNTNSGSVHYVAPEVISGNQHIGCEVDVWSCGVVLYALLSGYLPFNLENIPKLYKLIKDGTYTIPSRLSASAKDLIARMLAVDPKSRITLSEVGKHEWFQSLTLEAVNEGDP